MTGLNEPCPNGGNMFGFRPDGKVVNGQIDPIIKLVPFIMRRRNDSQVFYKIFVNSAPLDKYIGEVRRNGTTLSAMTILIAAYVRTLAELPVMNRFVVNKQIYDRNEIAIAFTILKSNTKENSEETTVKLFFKPGETLSQINKKITDAINENKPITNKSSIDKLVRGLLSLPFLTNAGVLTCMFLDRYGLLPKTVINLSPFHSSLFVSNMASIGMDAIYHHIYNFGTTSAFMGIGKKQRRLKISARGEAVTESCYPVGIVIDERIATGAQYALFFNIMKRYLKNPELLELAPDEKCEINRDAGVEMPEELAVTQ